MPTDDTLGHPAPEYVKPAAEEFVHATQVARELGISRRSFARRLRESIERDGLKETAPLQMKSQTLFEI